GGLQRRSRGGGVRRGAGLVAALLRSAAAHDQRVSQRGENQYKCYRRERPRLSRCCNGSVHARHDSTPPTPPQPLRHKRKGDLERADVSSIPLLRPPLLERTVNDRVVASLTSRLR